MSSTLISPTDLGILLRSAKHEVLRSFIEQVRAKVPGAEGETRAYIEDHLGDVVEELCEYLETDGRPTDLVATLHLAKVHGRQRADGEHYSVDDLRAEYRILRALLFSFIPEHQTLSTRAALLFGEAFDLCVSRSVEAFVRASASELGAHRDLLAAHEALRESEAALKFTLASAKLGTFTIDLTRDARLTVSNETAQMFGITTEPRNARTVIEQVLHPADLHRVLRVLREAPSTGETYADEYRIVLPSGEIRWIEANRRAHVDSSGTATMISGLVRDITERKLAEESFRNSSGLLALAAAGGHVGLWHIDMETGWFLPDATMAAQWGIDLATFPNHVDPAFAIVHPDYRETVRHDLAAAIEAGTPYDLEYKIIPAPGVERWIHARGEGYPNAEGRRTLVRGVSIDITDRKLGQLAEQERAALVALERQNLEEVLEQTSVPTALLSGPEHVFTFANTAYRTNFSVDASVIGRPIRDVMPDAVAQGFGSLLDRVYTTGEPFSGHETLFDREMPDGRSTPIYVDFTYAAKRGADGRIEGVLATIVVVTERVLLRKEVERANERLRAESLALDQIFQASPAGMAIWRGEELVFERANAEFAKFYGGRALIGLPLLEAAPELRGQGFDDLLRGVLRTGEIVRGTEVAVKMVARPGGEPEDRYYDFAYIPLSDEQGRRYGVHDFAIDVTDRVVASRERDASEARVRDAERQLQRAIQVAKVGFYNWDLDTDQIVFSEQMQRDWGFHAGTTLEDVVEHIHPDDRERVGVSIAETVETGERYFEEYRVVRPTDHATVWIEAQGEIIVDEDTGARRWFGTSLDITERKANEETLKAATFEAKNANVAKSAFLANMSHEIRTPLGAIMGFAELLRNPELSSSELLNFVAVIERNSQHLLRIVDDILDLSKVEAGKMLFERIEFSLPALVSDFASLMAYRAREKGIEFALRFDSVMPDLVLSDPTRLRQILNNVVGNAIKFTERGEVELAVRFDDRTLTFAVRDTGRGLSREQAERLFQAFVQADESTTRQFGGTGLGLVLTKRLANAMGGDFVLERSEPGVGSTFTASVVVELSPRARISRPTSRHATDESARPNDKRRLADMRILVVDDSPDNRTLLGTLLRKVGAIVEVAADGAEGVAMALSKRYDAVLMDIQMPRLDGYQALERLKDARFPAPVVALTAHAMVEERARAEGKGFFAFLSKPIRSELLLELLDDVKRRGATPPPASRLAILVEDDADSRALLETIIRKRGFDVIGAGDGAQALAAITGPRVPDLVLLDLSLPDMSGADVIARIRADPALASCKVVVVSGWDNLAHRARELGADDSIPKPIELPRLKTVLATLFADLSA